MEISKRKFNNTKKRLKQRFNIDIDKKDYIKLCELSKDSYMCREYKDNKETRMIEFKNKTISVGFNKNLGLVNTVVYNKKRDLKYYKIYKELFY